jgi:hypothetical protein
MGFWGGVRDWINNLPWTDQNYLDQQRELAEMDAFNKAMQGAHPITDWYDTSSTWPSGDDDYEWDDYPGAAPYNSGSDFPTTAQEDAYAQGLVLSPAAAEVWAQGSGPDPADGPITQADIDEFEREVAGGAYDPANYPDGNGDDSYVRPELTAEELAQRAAEDQYYRDEAAARSAMTDARAADMTVDEAREIIARDRELSDHISGCNQDVGNCSTCSAEEAKGWGEVEADATDSVAAERRLAREEREREQEANDGHDNGREGRDEDERESCADDTDADEDDELADAARDELDEELAWHDEHEAWLDDDGRPSPDAVPTDLQPDGSIRDENGTTTAAVADAREAAEEQAEAEQAPARTDDSNDDERTNDTAAGC